MDGLEIIGDSMPCVAITGANGFLGRYLVAECIKQKRFNLRLLVRNRRTLEHLSNEGVDVVEGDLTAPESLKPFLKPGCTLVNLAYINDRKRENIEAISNLIEAVRESGVKRVIHCSTAVVVGFKGNGVITEDMVPAPENDYQKTKYQIEETLRTHLVPGTELAILRPTEIIGPGGQGLQWLIERLDRERPCKRFLYHFIMKARRFNYVSVYNVVAALILLIDIPAKQVDEIYNVSDDDDRDNTYEAVEKIVCSALQRNDCHGFGIGLPLSVLSLALKMLSGHSPPNRVYSSDKIAGLGYRRKITLRSAVSEIVASRVVKSAK